MSEETERDPWETYRKMSLMVNRVNGSHLKGFQCVHYDEEGETWALVDGKWVSGQRFVLFVPDGRETALPASKLPEVPKHWKRRFDGCRCTAQELVEYAEKLRELAAELEENG